MKKQARWLLPAGYIGTIFLANWLIVRFGAVPVGFGLYAPAGVYAAGLAFTLRDLTQDALGRAVVIVCIAVGALVSALVAPAALAIASATAFGFSELADYGVYQPLRERHWLLAVGLSNTVGLVFDSVLFLWLAFHSFDFLPGQIVGKAWMTLAALIVLVPIRRVRANAVAA